MLTLPQSDIENIFSNSRELWPCGKIFLITGGTGFMGRWLSESIYQLETRLDANNQFYILTRLPEDEVFRKIPVLKNKCFHIISSDILNLQLPDIAFNYVIHAATDVAKAKKDKCFLETMDSIIIGTRNLLEAVKNSPLEKFLYISSGAVYGNHTNPVSELSPCNISLDQLSSGYAEGKRIAEWLVNSFSSIYKFPANNLRCFSFLGPCIDAHMAAMNFLKLNLKGHSIEVEYPETVRSYMYPTDLIRGIFLVLFKAQSKQTYNLGSEEQVNMLNLAGLIQQESPAKIKLSEQIKEPSLAGSYYVPDIKKIQRELNFRVEVNLKNALLKTHNYLLNGKI